MGEWQAGPSKGLVKVLWYIVKKVLRSYSTKSRVPVEYVRIKYYSDDYYF